MKHWASRDLYAYWDSLRGARSAPERCDLDPAAIRSILADTLLLEITGDDRHGERDAVVRLSGTRLNALWCGDIKGRSFVSLWRPEDHDAARDLVDVVLQDRMPVVAGVMATAPDQGATELELLLLPLRHHGKTHARLLGSIVPLRPPAWLGLHIVEHLRLTSFRSIAPAHPMWRGPARTAALSTPLRHGRFTVHQGGRDPGGEARGFLNRADRL